MLQIEPIELINNEFVLSQLLTDATSEPGRNAKECAAVLLRETAFNPSCLPPDVEFTTYMQLSDLAEQTHSAYYLYKDSFQI